MKTEAILVKRTFEAKKYPVGNEERKRLNLSCETSEYMTSYKFLVKQPFVMSDGNIHPRQPFTYKDFRTLGEAKLALQAILGKE